MTIAHRFEYPRRHTVRLFVCEAHAVGHPDPRPLTDHDRAELRRRRTMAYRRDPSINDALAVRTRFNRGQGWRRR
jgi:hypothetical protein